MAKFELLKTIEATKLNKRTLRALGPNRETIPYGAIVEDVTEDRDRRKFFYLGEPYECFDWELKAALRELK
jgi:hypothetical protein